MQESRHFAKMSLYFGPRTVVTGPVLQPASVVAQVREPVPFIIAKFVDLEDSLLFVHLVDGTKVLRWRGELELVGLTIIGVDVVDQLLYVVEVE